jgi:hypothetical protein
VLKIPKKKLVWDLKNFSGLFKKIVKKFALLQNSNFFAVNNNIQQKSHLLPGLRKKIRQNIHGQASTTNKPGAVEKKKKGAP